MYRPPFPRRGVVSNLEGILNSDNNKWAFPSRLQLGRGGEDTDRDFVTDCIGVNCGGFDVSMFECLQSSCFKGGTEGRYVVGIRDRQGNVVRR